MKDKMVEHAKHEYSPRQRLVTLVFLAPIFLLILPFAFVWLGTKIDQWLGWSPFPPIPLNLIVGGLMIILGAIWAMWTIYAQFTIGRGTPIPLMATQKLIVQPPFTYCRNPMTLGTLLGYLGVAILFRSIGAGILVLLFVLGLLIYIKRVEEVEMELRFGQEYLDYKQRTPFLLPRFWKRS